MLETPKNLNTIKSKSKNFKYIRMDNQQETIKGGSSETKRITSYKKCKDIVQSNMKI